MRIYVRRTMTPVNASPAPVKFGTHWYQDRTGLPCLTVATIPLTFALVPERSDDVLQPTPPETVTGKPPYRVPSMAEIAEIPWNGYTVASTFSGGGGSSLGYRMAGYRVAYANEFVEAARETYRANASPGTVVDGRDIRELRAEDLLADLGMAPGELDILDGSPPCASFSTAGKRHKAWGQVKAYSDTTQRTDDLFYEYVRLLEGVQPKVFVAENVSGLVKGSAKGYFQEIMRAMKGTGYKVSARLLDAQWMGVPQARQRLIFVGVREDLAPEPVHPDPLPYRYSVRDALPWILDVRSNPRGSYPERVLDVASQPSWTIIAGTNGSGPHELAVQGPTDPETGQSLLPPNYVDEETGARLDLPPSVGGEWDKGEGNSGRYSQVTRTRPGAPSGTVMAQSQWQTLHPVERRKFTLGELRRICSFPDDFQLTGTYVQRWERLGRAVPPLMMRSIAETVRTEILDAL